VAHPRVREARRRQTPRKPSKELQNGEFQLSLSSLGRLGGTDCILSTKGGRCDADTRRIRTASPIFSRMPWLQLSPLNSSITCSAPFRCTTRITALNSPSRRQLH